MPGRARTARIARAPVALMLTIVVPLGVYAGCFPDFQIAGSAGGADGSVGGGGGDGASAGDGAQAGDGASGRDGGGGDDGDGANRSPWRSRRESGLCFFNDLIGEFLALLGSRLKRSRYKVLANLPV